MSHEETGKSGDGITEPVERSRDHLTSTWRSRVVGAIAAAAVPLLFAAAKKAIELIGVNNLGVPLPGDPIPPRPRKKTTAPSETQEPNASTDRS